jgi:hypothetical protein
MDYATANQRIAAKQRSTSRRAATRVPHSSSLPKICPRRPGCTRSVQQQDTCRIRRRGSEEGGRSIRQNYQLAHPGATLATCYKAFAEKYPTLAKVYSTPFDMRG